MRLTSGVYLLEPIEEIAVIRHMVKFILFIKENSNIFELKNYEVEWIVKMIVQQKTHPKLSLVVQKKNHDSEEMSI